MKSLILSWSLVVCLLTGCAYFSLRDGKAKFTVPFDFPQKKVNNQTVTDLPQ